MPKAWDDGGTDMADNNTAGIGFEKQIWDAACVLRGNIDASEYKSVVLGLIFLKYISDQVEIERGMTTSSVAIFVPFTTQELFQSGKEALYCGINALSNNLIMVDRKLLKNPNGLILGTPGSGKSFAAKREIANVFMVTDDDIIICDPESEYGTLVERLGGQVIKISPTSSDYINPMDLNLNYSDDENPLSLKSDFILSLCELIVGGKEGLQPVEKTIILWLPR